MKMQSPVHSLLKITHFLARDTFVFDQSQNNKIMHDKTRHINAIPIKSHFHKSSLIQSQNRRKKVKRIMSLKAMKQALFNFSGAMAPVATPYTKEGGLNLSQIAPYANYLTRIGVKGVYIMGTTGEGFSLNLKEKLSLIQAWRQAIEQQPVDQKLTAVVNVSATIVSDVIELAKKVEELRFDGIAILPPIYYTASTKAQLVNYVKNIMSKAAPNTPFLYYHIPAFTGELKFELENFIESALEEVPQFVALKFTDNNLVRYGSVQRKFGDRINFFAGYDEILLPTIAFGCRAAIGASLSFADSVAQYHSLVEAFDRNDLTQARADQLAIANKCAELRSDGNFFATLKKVLNKELEGEGLYFGDHRASGLFN